MTTELVNETLSAGRSLKTIGGKLIAAIFPGGVVWEFPDDDFVLLILDGKRSVTEDDWCSSKQDALAAIRLGRA